VVRTSGLRRDKKTATQCAVASVGGVDERKGGVNPGAGAGAKWGGHASAKVLLRKLPTDQMCGLLWGQRNTDCWFER